MSWAYFHKRTGARESGSWPDSLEELPFTDTTKLLHKAEGTPDEGFLRGCCPQRNIERVLLKPPLTSYGFLRTTISSFSPNGDIPALNLVSISWIHLD